MFAPSLPYNESHRHFSHLMAIHPLGLIQWEDGEEAQSIIKNTIRQLDAVGPDWWCGYSYAWMGSVKARAKDGAGAAEALSTFARAFCLPNSFHVNGDQTKSGLSKFTYRPFTLEGNFAFAAGLQEMLLAKLRRIHRHHARRSGRLGGCFLRESTGRGGVSGEC